MIPKRQRRDLSVALCGSAGIEKPYKDFPSAVGAACCDVLLYDPNE
jgi:hypothetical protein